MPLFVYKELLGWPGCILFLATIFQTVSAAASPVLLRAAETHPYDYPTTRALEFMGEKLSELSNGRFYLKIYPGGQLGEERDTLEITIFGGIDINRINLAPLNSIVPETVVLSLPFLFRSVNHMRKTVDGPVGDEILSYLEPHGLIGLAYYDSGARSFYTTSKHIYTPADLTGQKIRVQNSDLYVAMMKALGANPTPMGFGQVYESLVLGAIDGSENNWPSYMTTGHYQVAPYYTLTRHTMTPEIIVMSKKRWDKLTRADRETIRQAAKASVPYMRKLWDQEVVASRMKLMKQNTHVVENIDTTPFVEAMVPVYREFAGNARLMELVRRIKAVQE